MLKQKTYSVINILGLGVSIGAVILVLLYISFEFSYDNFYKDSDDIYRVSVKTYSGNKLSYDSHIYTPAFGPAVKDKFTSVKSYTRFSTSKSMYLSADNKIMSINNIIYADSTFPDFFNLDMLAGSPKDALINPFTIVLTEQTALKIFSSLNVLGKTIVDTDGREYEITGVVNNSPANSSIKFNALISFESLFNDAHYSMGWNGGNQYTTYIKLTPGASPQNLQAQFPPFMWQNINKIISPYNAKHEPYLQSISSVHFIDIGGYTKVYIFGAIGLLILLIASINFINLTTAQYSRRSKEIGVRKVLGADKKILIIQFLTETTFITMFALVIGMVFAEVCSPLYRDLMQTDFSGLNLLNLSQFTGLISLLIVVGLIAGSYPAFYLSSFDPADVFKKNPAKQIGRFSLQNLLIVFQFVTSISLIIITIIIAQQNEFINNKELGYDKENIVLVPLSDNKVKTQTEYLKQKFLTVPGVINASASSQAPSNGFTANGYVPEGYSTALMINVLDVDEDFFNTYNIQLVDGRKFSNKFVTDKENYIVNQALAKNLGWNFPIGKRINRNGEHEIIGVVKNFNYASLRNNIEPLIITNHPDRSGYNVISLKVRTTDYHTLFSRLKNEWEEVNATVPFEYSFLDEKLEMVYNAENNFMKLFTYLAALAVTIAALGLFSLSSLSVEQKTKEIGVRKILGASVPNIALLMIKKYLFLVVIADLIAVPVAYYYAAQWLSEYAFSIKLTYMPFLIAFTTAIILASLAVGFQSLKAALTNPVNALKYE